MITTTMLCRRDDDVECREVRDDQARQRGDAAGPGLVPMLVNGPEMGEAQEREERNGQVINHAVRRGTTW